MKTVLMLVLCQFFASVAHASNTRPSSGRPLDRGHWLTCNYAGDVAVRVSSTLSSLKLNKDSPQSDVDKDIPNFQGKYNFQVQDTWEEWVTRSGNDCFRCGETCTQYEDQCVSRDNKGNCTATTRVCVVSSCNFCSWQELETFYRPWSVQKTNWSVTWKPDPNYRQKRQKWISDGRAQITRDTGNLAQLLNFDPDRPNEYFLFPGESEIIQVQNGAGKEIYPSVSIKNPRSEHKIGITVNGGTQRRDCDDVDLDIKATVSTGQRLVTETPNSIEFHTSWVDTPLNSAKELKEEPLQFRFVDTSALFYEDQNVLDHFKDTKVMVKLFQHDRFYWFDRGVSGRLKLNDTTSVIGFHEDGSPLPPFAQYQVKAEQLLRTNYTGKQFHLIPGATYDLCTKMLRLNNVYYKTKILGIWWDWSAWNCQTFTFAKSGKDLRSGARTFKDGFNRWSPTQPIFYIFDFAFDPFTW